MGSNKLYVTVDPTEDVAVEELLDDLPTGDFFRWTTVRDGIATLCRHSLDREVALRMLDAEATRIARAAMIEVHDTSVSGVGYLYERVGDELVLVDELAGGEEYGDDVANYFDWRHDLDARR